MDHLPTELHYHIISFCEPLAIVRLAQVSKYFRSMCLDDRIWADFSGKILAIDPPPYNAFHHFQSLKDENIWRELYRRRPCEDIEMMRKTKTIPWLEMYPWRWAWHVTNIRVPDRPVNAIGYISAKISSILGYDPAVIRGLFRCDDIKNRSLNPVGIEMGAYKCDITYTPGRHQDSFKVIRRECRMVDDDRREPLWIFRTLNVDGCGMWRMIETDAMLSPCIIDQYISPYLVISEFPNGYIAIQNGIRNIRDPFVYTYVPRTSETQPSCIEKRENGIDWTTKTIDDVLQIIYPSDELMSVVTIE